MKFTLKDYQDEAVAEVLSNLRKARRRWHEDGDRHAFSLSATTGAGKTVQEHPMTATPRRDASELVPSGVPDAGGTRRTAARVGRWRPG